MNLFRSVGKSAAHRAGGRFLDPKLGFELMKDRTIPVGQKFAACAIGVCITLFLVAVEFPLEAIVGVIPGVGLFADVLVDGAEFLIVPVVASCVVLPKIAKRRNVG